MNKSHALHYFNVKELNTVMKRNKIPLKYYVEKDYHGDYRLKTSDSTGNLPEKLELKRQAKIAFNETWNKKKEIFGTLGSKNLF